MRAVFWLDGANDHVREEGEKSCIALRSRVAEEMEEQFE